MVSKQLTQTAGNRSGDPIRGAMKKERPQLETGKAEKKEEEDGVGSSVDLLHTNVQQGLVFWLFSENDCWPMLE